MTDADDHTHCPNSAAMSQHDCDDAIAQLYSYLDGELDADVVARVEFHLQRCSPCLEAYDFEAELRKVIVAKCEESVPGDLRQRIMDVLDRLEQSSGGDLSTPGV
jgi:anti-sigma factor (TIGR02949 family)